MGAGWTDERERILKRMWSEGASCSQIADELGGLTRNAVIGKVHRLGLAGRAKSPAPGPRPRATAARARHFDLPARSSNPINRARRIVEIAERSGVALVPRAKRGGSLSGTPSEREEIVARASAKAMEAFTAPEQIGWGVSFEDLKYSGQCKWPYGDRPPYVFCGGKVPDEMPLPYCRTHFFNAIAGVRRGREVLECKPTG